MNEADFYRWPPPRVSKGYEAFLRDVREDVRLMNLEAAHCVRRFPYNFHLAYQGYNAEVFGLKV
jgi:hypothetical protein